MTPYYSDELATLFHGDCRDILATLPDNSVDSIVTDPPYELGFMGKSWDNTGVAYDVRVWTECLRVLKPGGHLLAFGGSRTYHRLAVAVEDAGFQIRDQIMWVYGSGFPKSLNVGKAIDKQRDDRAQIYEVTAWIRSARDSAGIGNRDIDDAFGFAGMAGHWTSSKSQPTVPTLDQIPDLLNVLGVNLDEVPDEIRDLIWTLNGRKGQPGPNWAKREITGQHKQPTAAQSWTQNVNGNGNLTPREQRDIPATDAARQWEGWGTALKPAHEPIVLARKPLIGTVADNVLTHGTGALNIDGCRVGDGGGTAGAGAGQRVFGDGLNGEKGQTVEGLGRWPANFIHDGSDEVTALFPDSKSSGQSFLASDYEERPTSTPFTRGNKIARTDSGSAARFFYSAKASKADRNDGLNGEKGQTVEGLGRWPANFIHDGSDEVTALFPDTAAGKRQLLRRGVTTGRSIGGENIYGTAAPFDLMSGYDDSGSAARFFYSAKASKADRNAGLEGFPLEKGGSLEGGNDKRNGDREQLTPRPNFHPTVKPTDLMRYLCRLITPPNGTVLDPFTGSGSTGKAAILEGFRFIGCELTDDYLPIIVARITHAQQNLDPPTLF